MNDILEARISGRLGKDPELKITDNGYVLVRFPVAVHRTFVRKNGTAEVETIWVDVEAWGRLGEMCKDRLMKGNKVYVEGRPEAHMFQRKTGEYGTVLRVKASAIKILEGTNNSPVEILQEQA